MAGEGDAPPVPLSHADLMKQLREIMAKHAGGSSAWEESWQAGVTPWDQKGVTPAVQELLSAQRIRPGRILVPGCGSGYDVLALASPERSVLGLDIAETAVKRFRQLRAEKAIPADQADVVLTDFFTYQPDQLFDTIFDYTFFCALHPSLRPPWGTTMARLLDPQGQLITLMFPLAEHEGGPPYAVSLDLYKEHLEPNGFELISSEPPQRSHEGREGKELVAVWEKVTPATKL